VIKCLPKDRIPRVVAARACGPFSVFVVFDDGVSKEVNLKERLKGPVYKPVRARGGFAKLRVDHEVGTIVWTDQADIAPETLYLLPDARKKTRQSKKPARRRKSSKGSSSAA
jgi:hypothetical protein